MISPSPIFRSPLLGPEPLLNVNGWLVTERYRDRAAELDQARQSVALADASPWGKLLVEGEAAEDFMTAAFGVAPRGVGCGVVAGEAALFQLRPDLFFVHTPPGLVAGPFHALTAALGGTGAFVTVTDVTHGRAEVRVIGPAASELLARVCGLDFDANVPNLAARQTSVAKTRQTLLRLDMADLPAFSMIGGRSFSRYVWETLLEAGIEWGSLAIGGAALAELDAAGVARVPA